ncbi:MAG TPA: hypothetical protein PKI66_05600 [Methanobacteriaceae archaeon]|nr:hypothetical protein [Methanobacteriaceae archaeon]HNS25838.1 hypothetical protein [Methanobacteriaceae archaeon]
MVFETLKKEKHELEETPDIEGYDEFLLNADMEPDMTFTGNPWMGVPYKFDLDYDGNKSTNYRVNFWIVNKENQEVLKTQLKLKSLEDEARFWENSLGFDLIDSIDQLHGGEGNHNILTISLKELSEYLNKQNTMTIRVIEHSAKIKGEITTWNSLKVTEIGG